MIEKPPLIHGGTGLSATLVEHFVDRGLRPLITVTRESARNLYPEEVKSSVRVGPLDESSYRELVRCESPVAIVDATHPFAESISQLAIEVANSRALPYLFLERNEVLPADHPLIDRYADWSSLIEELPAGRRILLTVGINRLEQFTEALPADQLIVRVLPRTRSFRMAEKTEVPRENLIGLWPPVSVDLERSILEDFEVDRVVSKASGKSGGLDRKWEACRLTGTSLSVVERPGLPYPNVTNRPEKAVEWVLEHARG